MDSSPQKASRTGGVAIELLGEGELGRFCSNFWFFGLLFPHCFHGCIVFGDACCAAFPFQVQPRLPIYIQSCFCSISEVADFCLFFLSYFCIGLLVSSIFYALCWLCLWVQLGHPSQTAEMMRLWEPGCFNNLRVSVCNEGIRVEECRPFCSLLMICTVSLVGSNLVARASTKFTQINIFHRISTVSVGKFVVSKFGLTQDLDPLLTATGPLASRLQCGTRKFAFAWFACHDVQYHNAVFSLGILYRLYSVYLSMFSIDQQFRGFWPMLFLFAGQPCNESLGCQNHNDWLLGWIRRLKRRQGQEGLQLNFSESRSISCEGAKVVRVPLRKASKVPL